MAGGGGSREARTAAIAAGGVPSEAELESSEGAAREQLEARLAGTASDAMAAAKARHAAADDDIAASGAQSDAALTAALLASQVRHDARGRRKRTQRRHSPLERAATRG